MAKKKKSLQEDVSQRGSAPGAAQRDAACAARGDNDG